VEETREEREELGSHASTQNAYAVVGPCTSECEED